MKFNDYGAVIEEAYLESKWLPRIDLYPTPKSDGKSKFNVGSFLRPKLTVKAIGGPYKYAPNGEPGESKWPLVKVGAGVLVFLLAVGAVTTGRRLLKKGKR